MHNFLVIFQSSPIKTFGIEYTNLLFIRALLRVPQRIVLLQRRLTLVPSKIKFSNFKNQISPQQIASSIQVSHEHLNETNYVGVQNQISLMAKKSTNIVPMPVHSSGTSGIGNFDNTQFNAIPSCSTVQAVLKDRADIDKTSIDKPQILTVTEVNELSERQINKPNFRNNECSSINNDQDSIISLSNKSSIGQPIIQNPECVPQFSNVVKPSTKSLNTTFHPSTRSVISVRQPSTRPPSAVKVIKMKTNLTVALCLFLALLNIIFLVSGINMLI